MEEENKSVGAFSCLTITRKSWWPKKPQGDLSLIETMNYTKVYERMKTRYIREIRKYLEHFYPNITDNIQIIKIGSPETTQRFLSHDSYGLPHNVKRFTDNSISVKAKGVENLWFSGQDIGSVGVPPQFFTALVTFVNCVNLRKSAELFIKGVRHGAHYFFPDEKKTAN
eukprot:Trichotokara_eunicae@DN5705_c0_g1_i2.p1